MTIVVVFQRFCDGIQLPSADANDYIGLKKLPSFEVNFVAWRLGPVGALERGFAYDQAIDA
jgi:hypothetical protein